MSSTFLWPIEVPPAPAPTSTGGSIGYVPPDVTPATIAVRGILRPFRRDGVSDFDHASGSRLVRSKLGQILGTRCSNDVHSGELPWRPEFGSLVQLVRHSNDTAFTREMLRVYIEDALRIWFPAIRVSDVEILGYEDTGVEGAQVARIVYQLRTRAGTIIDDTAEVALPAVR